MILKETIELRANSESEAKEVIESYRKSAKENGDILGSAGYTYKTKKSKGEIIDEGYLVKIVLIHHTFWEEIE